MPPNDLQITAASMHIYNIILKKMCLEQVFYFFFKNEDEQEKRFSEEKDDASFMCYYTTTLYNNMEYKSMTIVRLMNPESKIVKQIILHHHFIFINLKEIFKFIR